MGFWELFKFVSILILLYVSNKILGPRYTCTHELVRDLKRHVCSV